jgi:hypothetical protein
MERIGLRVEKDWEECGGSCTSCWFILEGTTAVVGWDFERIEIEQYATQKVNDKRHTYSVVVRVVLGETIS